MNTTLISNAQLNVSKHYTVETIDKLLCRLNTNLTAYYNTETKSIDIEIENEDYKTFDITIIKTELKEWLKELPTYSEYINIICDNIDFVFNITILRSDNKFIIKLYLY